MEERKKQSSWRNSLGWGRVGILSPSPFVSMAYSRFPSYQSHDAQADDAVLPIADEGSSQAPNCRLCGYGTASVGAPALS
jgi:hypothetical protein